MATGGVRESGRTGSGIRRRRPVDGTARPAAPVRCGGPRPVRLGLVRPGLVRPGLVVAAVLSLAVAVLSGTRPAAADAGSPLGLNVHVPQGRAGEVALDAAASAGAGWVRVDFVWAEIEPEPGRFAWKRYDELVEGARDRGLSVLGLLQTTPAWATDGPPGTGVPREVVRWQLFCFAAADRYRGRVGHWEVWNEPNLRRFFAGDRDDYIDRILIPAADALRAADPAARVGGPALSHHVEGDADWHRWLYEVLVRAGDRLDFVTHHVYDSDGHRDVTRRLERSTPAPGIPALWDLWPPSVREVLELGGWLGKPFWVTETGWPTVSRGIARPSSEAWQAREIGGLLGDWLSGRPGRDWLHKVFVYEIVDARGGSPRFGLLRPDLTPKPSWFALRDLTEALGIAPAAPEAEEGPREGSGGGPAGERPPRTGTDRPARGRQLAPHPSNG